MLTNIVIYILCCFLASLFISIFLPFKEEERTCFLERYIVNVFIVFILSAFIVPLIIITIILSLVLIGFSIGIVLFSTVGCIYLLSYYSGSVLFSFT